MKRTVRCIMPKMKTHKGAAKRMKVTATGKIRHKRSNTSHLMSTKNGRRVRKLRRPAILGGKIAKRLRIALGG